MNWIEAAYTPLLFYLYSTNIIQRVTNFECLAEVYRLIIEIRIDIVDTFLDTKIISYDIIKFLFMLAMPW